MAAALNLNDGFRSWLEKAVRIEEDAAFATTGTSITVANSAGYLNNNNIDWSPHTVDYASFKVRLRYFVQRRVKLRTLLRDSEDHCVSEATLEDILTDRGNHYRRNVNDEAELANLTATTTVASTPSFPFLKASHNSASACGDVYIPFDDDDEDLLHQASSADEAFPDPAANAESTSKTHRRLFRRKNHRSVMRRTSRAERAEMIAFLSWETEKAQLFYMTQWQRLSAWMDQAERSSPEQTHAELENEILELVAFCVINIITVRQMLIRYDAFARSFEGTPMLHYYTKRVMKHPTPYRKLLLHEELSAIADAYQQRILSCHNGPDAPVNAGQFAGNTSRALEHFQAQRDMFATLLASTEKSGSIHAAQATAPGAHERLAVTLLHTLRDWYLLGAFEDRLGLEPAYLTMRGLTLNNEMSRIAEWRKTKHMEENMMREERPVKRLTGMQVYHLTINLLSGFLYCMNYYIVEPSSTMYCNRLGARDAMSGTLIGMMPLAAFLSSVPFSMWTNHSFRRPFICSCFLLITGNIIYSLADRHGGNIKIALLGRFICGLGAPKCIIRRYMADTTPLALRTSVNAGFGMVVAAGSAMGPAMAVMLNRIEYVLAVPYFGIFIFNGLTLPGYFMASLWFTFTVIVLATFEEPDRDGLAEQLAMEQTGQDIPVSPSSCATIDGTEVVVAADQEPATHANQANINDEQRELRSILSCDDLSTLGYNEAEAPNCSTNEFNSKLQQFAHDVMQFCGLITLPVRICLGLLFAKVFTIEALVSATSALTKNRYNWKVQQVGTLGFTNGLLVIPFSILVGRLSMSYQDHVLMRCLVALGSIGLFLLIDISDLRGTPTSTYNVDDRWAVSPKRYIAGYFLAYMSIQSFEGVIGSTLSKVIPTALASGTINSGLLATLVDTFGRACGDMFISAMGYISIRQLMDLLFIPTFCIMLICLLIIHRYKDLLSV